MCDRKAVQLVRDKFPEAALRPNESDIPLMKLARQLGIGGKQVAAKMLHEATKEGVEKRGVSAVHMYRLAVGTHADQIRTLEAIGQASKDHGTGHLFSLFAEAAVPDLLRLRLLTRSERRAQQALLRLDAVRTLLAPKQEAVV